MYVLINYCFYVNILGGWKKYFRMDLSLITFLNGEVKSLPVALKRHIYISLSSFFY